MTARESTTQPIICCVGPSVAGQPTQFLLERAFEHARLHWKAISVEVEPDNFELVCQGMLAMGFQGLRFYDQFQQTAIQNLASSNLLASFVGSATSAGRIGHAWHVWENRGPAWFDLLSSLQASIICLHGDSIAVRSLFGKLVHSPIPWAWSHAPIQVREINSETVSSASPQAKLFEPGQLNLQEFAKQLGLEIVPEKLDSESAAQPVTRRLAIVTDEKALPNELADVFDQGGLEIIAPEKLTLDNQLSTRCIHRISAADLAVAAEAYDFAIWTGQTIDSSVLRDAYDEYCDF